MNTNLYISVCEENTFRHIEVPVTNNEVGITILQAQFGKSAIGLRYETASETLRGLSVIDGKILPPIDGWNVFTRTYLLSREVTAVTNATTDTVDRTIDPREDSDEEEVTNMSLVIGKSRRKVPEALRGQRNNFVYALKMRAQEMGFLKDPPMMVDITSEEK